MRRNHQSRCSLKEQEHRKTGSDKGQASMKKAQNLAKDILNLSQSDLDEIMSADGDTVKMVMV